MRKFIASVVSGKPKLVIAITLFVSVFLSLGISRLWIDNDMMNWVSPDSDIGRLPHYIKNKFGSVNMMMIGIEVTNGKDVFNEDVLKFIRKVSRQIKDRKDVSFVQSLTEIEDITSSEEGIKVSPLVGEDIPSGDELLKLKKYVLSKDRFAGKIVSKDGRVALIIAHPVSSARGDVVADEVRKVVENEFSQSGLTGIKLWFGGIPYLMNDISALVRRDLKLLVPLVVVVIVGVLWVSFRSWRGVFIPLVSVVLGTSSMMGFMGWLDVPLSVIGAAMPVILMAVASAYGIHFLNSYYENVSYGSSPSDVVKISFIRVSVPILMAGLTTAVGFISLATASLKVVQDFGIFLSIGVAFSLILALSLVPSILAVLPLRKAHHLHSDDPESTGLLHRFLEAMINLVLERRKIVIGFVAVVVIVAVAFATRIKTDINYLSYFPKNSETRVVSKFIDKNFGGATPVQIYVKADMENPLVLREMLKIEAFLRTLPQVSNPRSIADIVAELNDAMTGIETIPDTKDEIANLWFFVEGKDMIKTMVTKDKKEALIEALSRGHDSDALDYISESINAFLRREIKNGKIHCMRGESARAEIVSTAYLMLLGYLKEAGVSVKPSEISNAVLLAYESAKKETLSKNAVVKIVKNYAMSDESEIEIDSDVVAENIGKRISQVNSLDYGEVLKVVKSAINKRILEEQGLGEEDLEDFAKSLIAKIRDRERTEKVRKAVEVLKSHLEGKGVDDELEKVAGVFLWKDVPSGSGNVAFEVKVKQSGLPYLESNLRRELMNDQITSLAIALILVLIMNSLTFKSFIKGLISLSAIVFTLVFNFGFMGLFNISLSNITVAIASIAVGVGIDYTIHFISRYSEEVSGGLSVRDALVRSVLTTGKAIVFNAMSVGLGFAVLLFANILPLRTLGAMLSLTMLVSSVGAIIIVPSFMFAFHLISGNSTSSSS